MILALNPYIWYALRRLRKPTPLDHLTQLDNPDQFLDQMFLAAGRNLAVASGFLPRAVRNEGKIAFLCCRALDAHEDLNRNPEIAAQRIGETADYLQGNAPVPPPPPDEPGNRDSDRLEYLVASRLPWLRQAVLALPSPRKERVEALVSDLARAMVTQVGHRSNGESRADYGEQVLGRVVRYTLDLMQVELPATVDPTPIGRLCQAINDLRDLHEDATDSREGAGWDLDVEKSSLWLELAEAATAVTSVLRGLRFSKAPGARAGLVYLTATTLKSCARQANYPLPWLARHPLCAALMAEALGGGYRSVLVQLEQTLIGLLLHLARSGGDAGPAPEVGGPKMLGLRQDAFESALADQHPDPRSAIVLKQVCRLVKYSILLTSDLPPAALSRCSSASSSGQLLMLSDYLMARAITVVQTAGLPVLGLFTRTCATLSEEMQEWPQPNDPKGHLAAFLTEVVGRAAGMPSALLERQCAHNRDLSRGLHLRDQQSSLLHRLKKHLFGAST